MEIRDITAEEERERSALCSQAFPVAVPPEPRGQRLGSTPPKEGLLPAGVFDDGGMQAS